MPLITTRTLMQNAQKQGVAVGAFNVIHLETAEGLALAAERAELGIILQLSQNCVDYHLGFTPIARGILAVAEESSAPVAVHLDHAEDADLARRAIDLGFGSVMFDGSVLPYDENVAETRRVVEYAHAHDVYVEAELGKIGGKDGAHAPGVRTDPDEAETFVRDTGVDALAVAVGSSHAMTERTASLDLDLIRTLRDRLPVPLVLHGSSGVPDDEIVAAVRAGMTKVNISTHLNRVFTEALREYMEADPHVVDSRRYVRAGRAALSREAQRLLELLANA